VAYGKRNGLPLDGLMESGEALPRITRRFESLYAPLPLARPFTTLLPAMTLTEATEARRIHRVTGRTSDSAAWVPTRLFRAPPSHRLRCGADRRRPRAEAE
jgi:hypothetical protein